jgi:hypothetical protein
MKYDKSVEGTEKEHVKSERCVPGSATASTAPL